MKKSKKNITLRLVVVTVILLFITNLILSAVLLHNSITTSKMLIHERMLDIANCASASVSGERFKTIATSRDAYKNVYDSLAAFRDNINKDHLKYIYAVYQGEDKGFYFAVDTDLDDPGKYGAPAGHGDGIYEAIKGTPSVDAKPYTDDWGTFFSAYSPIRDNSGEIVGLVVVDFDANWYTQQIRSDMSVIIIVCVISVLVSAAAVFFATEKLRQSLSRLYTEMDILYDDISDLTADISVENEPRRSQESGDDISETVYKIRYLQSKVRMYISRVKSQAFSDSMTGVGNRTAFAELTAELNKKIEDKTADFSIAVFDINGLKHINDETGHEEGDRIIIDAAAAIKDVFGVENTFRIGGDEFIVVMQHTTTDEMESLLERLDRTLNDVNNRSERKEAKLYISKGTVSFRVGLDNHFNDVFRRADEAMYHDKAAFYLRRGDRRKMDMRSYLEHYPNNENKDT